METLKHVEKGGMRGRDRKGRKEGSINEREAREGKWRLRGE